MRNNKSKTRAPPPGMEKASAKKAAPPGLENVTISNKDIMTSRFVWTHLQLYGYVVSIQVKNGTWYKGIFKHMDEKTFDVTLDKVTRRDVREKSQKSKSFRSQDIVQLLAEEVDTRNVAKDLKFMTDTDISASNSTGERELVAWSADGEDAGLEGGLGDTKGAGIGKFDQFAVNERKFGVKSTYDETLYTTKLDKSKLSKQQKQKAERQAREILSKSSTNVHVMEDRGKSVNGDEEALYGAVVKNKSASPKKKKRETNASKTNIGTNKKRINETVSDDRKQTTNELKTFHKKISNDAKSGDAKTANTDTDSNRNVEKDGDKNGSDQTKFNVEAAEWNPNATEWKPPGATPPPSNQGQRPVLYQPRGPPPPQYNPGIQQMNIPPQGMNMMAPGMVNPVMMQYPGQFPPPQLMVNPAMVQMGMDPYQFQQMQQMQQSGVYGNPNTAYNRQQNNGGAPRNRGSSKGRRKSKS